MLDLHMHSTASDGTDTPEELIKKCARLRLEACSVTDHDTVDAQPTAKKLAIENKLNYITGVEFSVRHEGELHILGYGIDINDKAFRTEMESLRTSRVDRVHAILEKLGEHNINVDFEDVKRFAGGNTLGRPHVALALMDKGYASDMQEAFNKYLNESGVCYVQRRKLNAKQAIELIAGAGGISVLAHPKFIKTDDIAKLTKELVSQGLGGIEAFYPAHTDAEVEKFLRIARNNDILVTEGSDYHGKMREYSAIACEKRTSLELEKSVKYLIDLYAG